MITNGLKNVCRYFGDVELDQFDRAHASEYQEKRGKEGVTEASVNRDIAAVKSMLSWVVDVGVIKHNPLIRFKMLREQEKSFHVLTPDEVDAIIERQFSPVNKALTVILAETGLRAQEAVDLQWRSIDLRRKILTVDKSKSFRCRA
jgi:integrase/recombinase XerD